MNVDMPSPNRYTVSTPTSCLGRWLTSGREARRIAALWADRSPETVTLTTVTPKETTLETVKASASVLAAREQRRLDALWQRSIEAAGGDPWEQSGGVPSGRGGYGVGL